MADDKTSVNVNANAASDGKSMKIDVNATINKSQSQDNSVPSINEQMRMMQEAARNQNSNGQQASKTQNQAQQNNAQQKNNQSSKNLLTDLNATLKQLSQAVAAFVKKTESTEAAPEAGGGSNENLENSLENSLRTLVYSERFKTDFSIIIGKGLTNAITNASYLSQMKTLLSDAAKEIGSDESQGGVPDTEKAQTVNESALASSLDKIDSSLSEGSNEDIITAVNELKNEIPKLSNLNTNLSDGILNALNAVLQQEKTTKQEANQEIEESTAAKGEIKKETEEVTSSIDQFIAGLMTGDVKIGGHNAKEIFDSLVDVCKNGLKKDAAEEPVDKEKESIDKSIEKNASEQKSKDEKKESNAGEKEGIEAPALNAGEEAETEIETKTEAKIEGEAEPVKKTGEEKKEETPSLAGGILTFALKMISGPLSSLLKKSQIKPNEERGKEKSGGELFKRITSPLDSFLSKSLSRLMPGQTAKTEKEFAPRIAEFAGHSISFRKAPAPEKKEAKEKEDNSEKDTSLSGRLQGLIEKIGGFGIKQFPNLSSTLSKMIGRSQRTFIPKAAGAVPKAKSGNIIDKIQEIIDVLRQGVDVMKEQHNLSVEQRKTAEQREMDAKLEAAQRNAEQPKFNIKDMFKGIGTAVKSGLSGIGELVTSGILAAKAKAVAKIIGILVGIGALVYLFFKSPAFRKMLGGIWDLVWAGLKGLGSMIWNGIKKFINTVSTKALVVMGIIGTIMLMVTVGWLPGLIIGIGLLLGALIYKFRDQIAAFGKALVKGLWFMMTLPYQALKFLFPNAAKWLMEKVTGLLEKIPWFGKSIANAIRWVDSDEKESQESTNKPSSSNASNKNEQESNEDELELEESDEEKTSIRPDKIESGNGSAAVNQTKVERKETSTFSSTVKESRMNEPAPAAKKLSSLQQIIEMLAKITECIKNNGISTEKIASSFANSSSQLIERNVNSNYRTQQSRSIFSRIAGGIKRFSTEHPVLTTIGLGMLPGVGGLAAAGFMASRIANAFSSSKDSVTRSDVQSVEMTKNASTLHVDRLIVGIENDHAVSSMNPAYSGFENLKMAKMSDRMQNKEYMPKMAPYVLAPVSSQNENQIASLTDSHSISSNLQVSASSNVINASSAIRHPENSVIVNKPRAEAFTFNSARNHKSNVDIFKNDIKTYEYQARQAETMRSTAGPEETTDEKVLKLGRMLPSAIALGIIEFYRQKHEIQKDPQQYGELSVALNVKDTPDSVI